jgi:WhiB family redox-sensing transcriptional regulator
MSSTRDTLNMAANTPWIADALCAQVDTDLFFPEKGGSTREAKQICRECTVAAECLDYALSHGERFGIWGGMSERQRRKLNGLPDDPDDFGAEDLAGDLPAQIDALDQFSTEPTLDIAS